MDMNRLKRLREADAILASDPEAAKDPERIRQMLAWQARRKAAW